MPYVEEYDHCDRCGNDYPVGKNRIVKAWRDDGNWTTVDSCKHLCKKCYDDIVAYMNKR